MYALPSFTDAVDMDSHVAKAIIVVCGVFVVYSRLERKAASWDIGDNPFAVPLWIATLPDGRGAE